MKLNIKSFPYRRTLKQYGDNISAKIYKRSCVKRNGNTYHEYTVRHRANGKSASESFADLEMAVAAADRAIAKLAEGQAAALAVDARGAAEHARAKELMGDDNTPLDTVVAEWLAGKTALNGTGSLREACEYYAHNHPKDLARKTVREAVDAFLVWAQGCKSAVRVSALTCHMNKFAEAFNVLLSEVKVGLVEKWLNGLPGAEASKHNLLAALRAFQKYAIREGWLKRGSDFTEGIRFETRVADIKTYSATDLALILANCSEELLPFIAIASLAGIRTSEVERLDWDQVELTGDDAHITLYADATKTGRRRIVPVCAALRAWLLTCKTRTGKVCKFKRANAELTNFKNAMKVSHPEFVFKKNGFRKSYISARMAQTSDAAKVSREAGNSPAMIQGHYDAVLRPAQGAAWFQVFPAALEAVVNMPQTAVAA